MLSFHFVLIDFEMPTIESRHIKRSQYDSVILSTPDLVGVIIYRMTSLLEILTV